MVNSDERVQIALTVRSRKLQYMQFMTNTRTHTPQLGSGAILVLTMMSEPFMKILNMQWMPASGLAILMGLILGGIVKASHNDTAIATQEFDSGLFTLLLLPVIIFEAAYHSSNYYVFLMLKPILLFAFIRAL